MVVNGDASPSWLSRLPFIFAFVAAQALAGHIGFGAPFFCVAAIAWMFTWGTGEKRWAHEASAYSVCNEGGAEIGGTLSGARLDDEMRSKPTGSSGAAGATGSSSPRRATRDRGGGGAGQPSEADLALKRQRMRDSALARLQKKQD